MSPQGTMLHEADNTESGQFSFTASETGSYLACITAVGHKPETTLTIDLDWRSGVHSHDWSKVVKKSQVEVSVLGFFYCTYGLGFDDLHVYLCV